MSIAKYQVCINPESSGNGSSSSRQVVSIKLLNRVVFTTDKYSAIKRLSDEEIQMVATRIHWLADEIENRKLGVSIPNKYNDIPDANLPNVLKIMLDRILID